MPVRELMSWGEINGESRDIEQQGGNAIVPFVAFKTH
jgi:hypothetical protein